MAHDPRKDPLSLEGDYDDPIVAEVHAARDKLFAEAGYDYEEYYRRMRARQALSGHRVVDFSRKPVDSEK